MCMETPEDGPSPFPLRESPRLHVAHRPSGNPNGIKTVGMDVDQFLYPETPPEDGPSPFPLPEFEGRALPHLPTGNPKGILP